MFIFNFIDELCHIPFEPDEFKHTVLGCQEIYRSLGSPIFGIQPGEETSSKERPSIFVVKDIDKGTKFDETYVKIIRPNNGLKPKYWYDVLKRRSKKTIKAGTPLSWDLVD